MIVQRKNVRMCQKAIEMSHPYVGRKGDSFGEYYEDIKS